MKNPAKRNAIGRIAAYWILSSVIFLTNETIAQTYFKSKTIPFNTALHVHGFFLLAYVAYELMTRNQKIGIGVRLFAFLGIFLFEFMTQSNVDGFIMRGIKH